MQTPPIKGHIYNIGKLDALKQFHVSRRIAPVLASMGITLTALRQGSAKFTPEDFAVSLAPVAEVMSNMNDDTVEYVIATCLAVVQRKQGDVAGKASWAPVATGAQVMFADIDMLVMLRLIVAVLQENLADFLSELPDLGPSASS